MLKKKNFPFLDQEFDVILFCEIIEHLLMDPVAVLKEIKRVMKPNGVLILTTPNVSRLENVANLMITLLLLDQSLFCFPLDKVCLWRRTQEEFSYDLKKTVLSFFEGKYRQPAKKLVLDKIDLVVEKGEKIGIIGSNGAGKSTLLKVISGILQPTTGTVRVRGQIAPLIELGAGFDSEISVMDNILLYGVLLGFSRAEMKERIESILDFAELQDYRFVPVKGLSSGMVARLGFAIATDIQPEILILDEVLSVGDESFRNKCQKRIDKFWDSHVTILVVSHSMDFIKQSCDQAIWLSKGSLKLAGDSKEVVKSYLDSVI